MGFSSGFRMCCSGMNPGELLPSALHDDFGRVDHDFEIKFDYMALRYKNGVFTMQFTDDKVGCGRTRRSVKLPKCVDIRLIADTSSMEIYLNGGQRVMSTRFYPQSTDADIRINGLNGNIYTLDGMEGKPRE